MQTDNSPRIVFVGDSGVGKTSIINYAKNGCFNRLTTPTIGAGIIQMTTNYNGEEINYQFWDTAGQEIYRTIIPLYYKGATCAIVVFALNDRRSFLSLESWIQQIHNNTDIDCGIVIVGNKSDADQQTVDKEEAQKWAKDMNYNIIFTSAVSGENIDLLVEHVCSTYVRRAKRLAPTPASTRQLPKGKSCC